MQPIPACSIADVAVAAPVHGLTIEELVGRAMEQAGCGPAQRLYVGSNFCSQYFLCQPVSLWREAFALCRREAMPATLVVPVVSQRDLAEACQLVDELFASFGDVVDEITVNDWGMFAYCRERHVRAVNLGRLFFKEPRDPRYARLFQTCHEVGIPAALTEAFPCDDVAGIEFDPAYASLNLARVRGLLPRMNVGVHMPYCYLSTGNICEFAGIHRPVRKKFRPNAPCALECAHCAVGYELPSGARMLKWGRTVYFSNHGCTVREGEDFRMIVTPFDVLVPSLGNGRRRRAPSPSSYSQERGALGKFAGEGLSASDSMDAKGKARDAKGAQPVGPAPVEATVFGDPVVEGSCLSAKEKVRP